MLLAYIDEIGEPGAFIAPDHPRFHTSPSFGYAGFIIPSDQARNFGAIFAREKRARFSRELAAASNPGRWEAKGADFFRPDTPQNRPENLRVFGSLVRDCTRLGGHLFYYADEKPLGTPKQTALDPVSRERDAMRETLNRIARHSATQGEQVMVLIDSINEKTRSARVADMYAHIFARTADHEEMSAIIEPPMHLDSVLSSNIQFADWIAAYVTRAIDYQLLEHSRYTWVPRESLAGTVTGSFTFESKLHLHLRDLDDFHHSEILRTYRPLFPRETGMSLVHRAGADRMRKIKAAAERQHNRQGH